MKIVMLCDFYQEGLEYQENLLVKYYVKNGHDVVVICSLYDDVFDYYAEKTVKGDRREYHDQGAKIVKLPYRYNILHKVRAYTSISGILEEERPDLIYVHDIMLNLPECVEYVKSHPETRMIMDYHADYSNSGKNWLSINVLHGVVRKWFLDRAMPHLDMIYPVVPAGIEFLKDVYGVPAHRMTLLPLGTDLEYAAQVREQKAGAALRAELGIPADEFVIFSGGKLDPYKQTEHLIEAFIGLGRTDVHLLVIGAPARGHDAYAEALRAAAGDHPNVHFRGWLDKAAIYAHLDAADIAVFPASQSVLWQQAIGMGLPLVVGDRSEKIRGYQDARYLNRHGNLVILDAERAAAEQIETLLRELIEDRARLRSMAQGALRTADELLNWQTLVGETLRFNRPAEIAEVGR